MLIRLARQWLILSCLTAVITACGGGGGGGGSQSSGAAGAGSSTSAASSPTSSPMGNHSVHVTWAAPTTRADGSALPISAIEGYRLFYFREGSSASEDNVVTISGATTTSVNLSLSTGTYSFAITAFDTNGAESALSAPVSITIN